MIDAAGELRLHYRKIHPWAAVEPWAPGNLGVPCATARRAASWR